MRKSIKVQAKASKPNPPARLEQGAQCCEPGCGPETCGSAT